MPLSKQDVLEMINRLPMGGKFVGRREVKELPNILWDDEEVLDLVQGFYNNGTGILVATQKRMLFVDKKRKDKKGQRPISRQKGPPILATRGFC